MMDNVIVTVKQLNTYVKSLIEGDVLLSAVSVSGEISNFKNHYSSGHWYFTLKDQDAQIRCVMFAAYASRVKISVKDGIKVVIKGRVSIYERDGQYQLYAEEILPAGEGDLAAAFNRLKEKLEKEGLFSPAHKRVPARFPAKIAVLTSDTGAAVRDILNILSKRYPVCGVLLCPVSVQGENAAASMISMLERVYSRKDVDTIIIGRGGGSLEDLYAFNDEGLARKIYESPVPVISAVGHETDFTICDFVADVRASTPSHAAELAVPDISTLLPLIVSYRQKYYSLLTSKYNLSKARYELLISKPPLSSPVKYMDEFSLRVDTLVEGVLDRMKDIVSGYEVRFSDAVSRIDALSPLKTISRGYAVVTSGNKRICSARELTKGGKIDLRFADGSAECEVLKIGAENE